MSTPEGKSTDSSEKLEEYRLATMADLLRGRGVMIRHIPVIDSPGAGILIEGRYDHNQEWVAPLAGDAIWKENLNGRVREAWKGRVNIDYDLPGNTTVLLSLFVRDESDIKRLGIMVQGTYEEGYAEREMYDPGGLKVLKRSYGLPDTATAQDIQNAIQAVREGVRHN